MADQTQPNRQPTASRRARLLSDGKAWTPEQQAKAGVGKPLTARPLARPTVPRAGPQGPPPALVPRRGDVAPIGDPNEQVAFVPPVPAGFRLAELTPMVPDRAWVRMLYDENDHTHLYEVIEPALSEDEQIILAFLRDTLVRTLDGRSATKDDDWTKVLVDAVRTAITDHSIRLSEAGARRVEYYLIRDFLGYGPIDVLMRDPMIEDISCDGPNIPLYLFHRKYESVKTSVMFKDEYELDSFVIRLAQRSRKHISVADPLLDATLPDGSRLQATLSREVTTRGSSFTVRKFRADPMTPPDLIRLGTFSAEMAAWFWFAMELGHSFILAGGTASGKTTSLNAICQFIPPEKKVVSIEDTREINLSHENWIAGVTRSGFGGEQRGGKQAGSIDMYKLLEAALRQRPEYLLVGEVRGPEALTLFQAMATGHAVYSTMHADSVPSAVYRLENPPINVPRMMLQTLDIVAIQAQVRIAERMGRRIREVTEVVGFDPETRELLTNTVFEWDAIADHHKYLGKSYVLEQVMESRNLSEEKVEAEWRNRVEVLDWMVAQNIRHVADVARILSRYYRDSAAFLAALRSGRSPEEMSPEATPHRHHDITEGPGSVPATPRPEPATPNVDVPAYPLPEPIPLQVGDSGPTGDDPMAEIHRRIDGGVGADGEPRRGRRRARAAGADTDEEPLDVDGPGGAEDATQRAIRRKKTTGGRRGAP